MTQTIDVAWEKIIWAIRKRDAIKDCLSDYFRKEPYRIVTGPDGKQNLEITEHPPVKLSIIVGEMLYQFRSALDHLFFDLVKRNNGTGSLPSGWERICQFPLITKLPDGYDSPPLPRDKFNCGVLDALTNEAFTFIEGVQPYYHGREASRLLYLLNKLSNIDKHRHLNTTILTVGRTQTAVTREGYTSTALSPWLPSGAEIKTLLFHPFDVTEDVEVTDEFTGQVLFDEPEIGPPHTIPVHDVVYVFPNFMLNFMIPNFKILIDNHARVPIAQCN